jgi:putative peptidoglycan lipid II flippase
MNLLWVPWFAHAGLALSIGLGAMINAMTLWYFLKKSGAYSPQAGWGKLLVQVLIACLVMGLFLHWARWQWDWIALGARPWLRVLMVLGLLGVSALLYLGALCSMGWRIKAFLNPKVAGLEPSPGV